MSEMRNQLVKTLIHRALRQVGSELVDRVRWAAEHGVPRPIRKKSDQLALFLCSSYSDSRDRWISAESDAVLLEAADAIDQMDVDELLNILRQGTDEKTEANEDHNVTEPTVAASKRISATNGRWGVVKAPRLVAFLHSSGFTPEKTRTGEQSYRYVTGQRISIPGHSGDIKRGTFDKIVKRLEQILKCKLTVVGGEIKRIDNASAGHDPESDAA